MGNSKDAYGKPSFDDTYSFPQDSQDAVDYADEFANLRRGPSADRQALPAGKQRVGMLWTETDSVGVYRSDGAGGWYAYPRIATGSFTLPIQAAGANQKVPITFPAGRFTVPPNVHVTPSNGRVTAAIDAGTVTTTGVTLTFDNWSPGPVGSPHTVYWTAIGV